jgi:hypothetical protein
VAINLILKANRGIFLLFYVFYSTLLHPPPLRFHCVGSEDAGIEPRTVATLAIVSQTFGQLGSNN